MASLVLAAAATTTTVNVQSRNPILPSVPELVWGILAFAIVVFLMWKYAFPSVKKGMDARTERIRESLSSAEQAKDDAEAVLAEYQRQLADARNEANRIIEEARQTADALRRDLTARAEADAAEIRNRATADIEAAKDRAMDELRSQLTDLAIGLAERVVRTNIDRDSNARLVDEYISTIGNNR
ncbi:MAG TPA: F0F1 ATP synthase subunit B [Acidimicrobiales bacterium]|jgi:F-type H+-transporting ATPase subunit b|nr:F0F1 ATP synthase subunit B [Acidimicrobiales bacterium]